jgi:biopolymer transport protein ExbD
MRSERSRTVRKRHAPQIDLVPLLDTIFLLLMFFVCAALLQSGSLPASLSGQGEQIKKYHTITITREKISGLDNIGDLPTLIKADAEVDFGRVREVLRRLRKHGATQINFAL